MCEVIVYIPYYFILFDVILTLIFPEKKHGKNLWQKKVPSKKKLTHFEINKCAHIKYQNI